MRRYVRVLELKSVDGELGVVIEAISLQEPATPDNKNPTYNLSIGDVRKIQKAYGIRWDGTKSSMEKIREKIRGRFLELDL